MPCKAFAVVYCTGLLKTTQQEAQREKQKHQTKYWKLKIANRKNHTFVLSRRLLFGKHHPVAAGSFLCSIAPSPPPARGRGRVFCCQTASQLLHSVCCSRIRITVAAGLLFCKVCLVAPLPQAPCILFDKYSTAPPSPLPQGFFVGRRMCLCYPLNLHRDDMTKKRYGHFYKCTDVVVHKHQIRQRCSINHSEIKNVFMSSWKPNRFCEKPIDGV